MKEIDKFYQSLMQDVVAMQSGDEDGNTQEQIFTRICLDMLSDAAETENVSVAYDERDLKKKGQHKINGYAISDNYETVDLFITLYANTTEIRTISKSEVDTASRMIRTFSAGPYTTTTSTRLPSPPKSSNSPIRWPTTPNCATI